MNVNKVVTFVGSREFNSEFAGKKRDFYELCFLVHDERYNGDDVQKVVVTVDKLNKAIAYSKIEPLKLGTKYRLWLADYKGDKKLRFSGIRYYDGK